MSSDIGKPVRRQKVFLANSYFYDVKVGAGAVLRGPLQNASTGGL